MTHILRFYLEIENSNMKERKNELKQQKNIQKRHYRRKGDNYE